MSSCLQRSVREGGEIPSFEKGCQILHSVHERELKSLIVVGDGRREQCFVNLRQLLGFQVFRKGDVIEVEHCSTHCGHDADPVLQKVDADDMFFIAPFAGDDCYGALKALGDKRKAASSSITTMQPDELDWSDYGTESDMLETDDELDYECMDEEVEQGPSTTDALGKSRDFGRSPDEVSPTR